MPRPRSLLLVGPVLVLLGAGWTLANSGRPPVESTGAPATGGVSGERTCARSGCHTGNPVNAPGGTVELLGLPETYVPGQAYGLTVRLTSSDNAGASNPRWGFSLTCFRASDGLGMPANAGDLVPGASMDTQNSAVREYLSHFPVITGGSSPAEWTFQWIAPAGDQGTIRFTFAGNAANGNLNSTGDFIYTGIESVEGPPTPVEPTSWGGIKARDW